MRLPALLRASAVVLLQCAAALAAVVAFGVFLLAVDATPTRVFADMLSGAFGSWFAVQGSLVRAAPLLLTALCTAIPARVGLVVIGNEGALLLGALAAAAVASSSTSLPSPIAFPLLLACGGVAGAAWIAIAGALRQLRGVNETISSLLLYYVGLGLFLYAVEGPLRDPASLNKPSTKPIVAEYMLGNVPGTDVHFGLVIGVAICLIAYVWMEHTRFGFAARVAGGGPRAARAVGLPISRLVIASCAIGGACAGLAGALEVVAVHGSANASLQAGLGFAGILVAFLARQHALAVIPMAFLLGGIEASGGLLQRRHDLPDAVIEVFKGMLFLSVLGSEPWVARAGDWVHLRATERLQRVASNVRKVASDAMAAGASSAGVGGGAEP